LGVRKQIGLQQIDVLKQQICFLFKQICFHFQQIGKKQIGTLKKQIDHNKSAKSTKQIGKNKFSE